MKTILRYLPLALAAFFLSMHTSLYSAVVTAVSSDKFVDTIGVNVHLHYTNTQYYTAYSTLKTRLQELGVRHIRDGLLDTTDQWFYDRINELASLGIKGIFITDLPMNRIVPTADKITSAIEAFEGPNEVNDNGWTQAGARQYQIDLWNTLAPNPTYQNIPVIGLSTTDAIWANGLSSLSSYCDYGNIHSYQGGWYPENTFNNCNLDTGIATATDPYPYGGKALWATETGYTNAVNATIGQEPVNETLSGAYLPRVYLDHYRSGIIRTYFYELINLRPDPGATDEQANYGILRNDLSYKPAGYALRNMVSILKDAGPIFPSNSGIDYSLSNPNVQSVLFQKRNGRFYLALWLQTSMWDNVNPYGSKLPVDPPDEACTVTFNTPLAHLAVYSGLHNSGYSTSNYVAPASINLTISERVIILAMTPTTLMSEAERLVVAQQSSGDVYAPFADAAASAGYAAGLTPNAVNDYFIYEVEVPETRSYSMNVRYKKWTSRGIVAVSVADTLAGPYTTYGGNIDCYSSSIIYQEHALGTKSFNSGKRYFKFTVMGKNAASSGYVISPDYIKLVAQ